MSFTDATTPNSTRPDVPERMPPNPTLETPATRSEGRRRPSITWLLLVLIGLAFGAELVVGYLAGFGLGGSENGGVLVFLGANVPELVRDGQVWRLVASMFLHIGFLHLLVNGWALYQLGGLFEMWMGARRFALVYMVAGIVGSAASVATKWGEVALSAGASGAIFGLLGALIAILLRRGKNLLPQGKALLQQLLMWAGINVVLGFSISGIDNAAHLGGCAAGFALGWFMKTRLERQISAPGSYSEAPGFDQSA